jgi:hypothetical protein
MPPFQQLNHWMDESESKRMNTYYTAKDIEELAANGTKQLVLGPGVFLTDYARETAQQLGIALVKSADKAAGEKPKAIQQTAKPVNNKYNKPRACQPGSNPRSAQIAQTSNPQNQPNSSNGNNSNANTVNRLIDLMGKVIKRGS